MSRNASDTEFPPPPVRSASPSGYTRPLGLRTGLLGSLQQSASFSAPLAPPSALIASGSTVSSSFPTSIFYFVALSPAVRFGSSRRHSKAFNESFRMSPDASREVRWMFRYALNSHFVPSPACFASSSGYSQPLRTRNTYPDSPNQSASIGAALKFPSALVALERTKFCSPTSLPPPFDLSIHPEEASAPFGAFSTAIESPQRRLSNVPAHKLNNRRVPEQSSNSPKLDF